MCQGFTARLVADVSLKKKIEKVMKDESQNNIGQKKKLINIEIFLLKRKTNASGEQKPLSVICKAGLLL